MHTNIIPNWNNKQAVIIITKVLDSDNSALVNELLGKIDVNSVIYGGSYSLLHYAARRNKINSVGTLIQNGANINARDRNGNTPLHFAAERNNLEVVNILLQNGANINASNNKWLFARDLTNNYNIRKLLEEHNIPDIKEPDSDYDN